MKIALLILFATSGVIVSTCAVGDLNITTTFNNDGKRDSTTGFVSDDMFRENVIKAIEFISRTLNVVSTTMLNFEKRYLGDSNRLPPYDCSALNIDEPSRIYTLILNFGGTHSVRAFCDQDTDGGGWTVILKRSPHTDIKTATNFNRTYTAFERGFGDPETDFWFGLDKLNLWTSYRDYELRVVLTDFDDATAYSHYDNFYIDREESGYKLRVSGYSGEAGDSLSSANNMMFSTYDLDQDVYNGNCAQRYGGGWWYKDCFHANLMSNYTLIRDKSDYGIQWYHWKNNYLSLKSAIMMIRRTP